MTASPAAVLGAIVLAASGTAQTAHGQTAHGQAAPMVPMASSMQASQAPCPSPPAVLPPELAGWSAAIPIRAAIMPAELALATVQPGRGVVATLSPAGKVSYPVTPGHPGEPGTSGGLFAFAVVQAGTYRIALGAGTWIDVVRDGRSVASIAHGHSPACSPIRKTVDFALSPGRYLLQVSGNKAPTLALLIAPVRP